MACSQMSKETAIEGAKVLLGCYRTGEANDPEVYARSVVAVLAEYPVDVIHAVCDPRYGIASKLKWLPTIAELKEACEVAMAPFYREAERQKRIADKANHAEMPRADRPTYDELVAKHGKNFGINQQDDLGKWRKLNWSPPSFEDMCANAGVSVEQAESEQEEARKWLKTHQAQNGR